MILEKVSGLSLEELMNKHIFKKYPDYFKHTSYAPKTYPQNEMQNMAHGYAMHPEWLPEFYGQDITDISLSWAGSAGALTTTTSDLVNWPILLFSNDFLPEKQREELQSLVCIDPTCEGPCLLSKDSKLMGYGLGIVRLYDPDYGYAWKHTGDTLGYNALFYLPQKSVVISIIINQVGPKIDDEWPVVFVFQQIVDNIKIL